MLEGRLELTETVAVATGELETKLAAIRNALAANQLAGVRLRGTDWFAWATCGGSSVVDTSAEVGVAEVLVTADHAMILADSIDGPRIRDEECHPDLDVVETPWASATGRDRTVDELVSGGSIASDRPLPGEVALPAAIMTARLRLTSPEIERYRRLSRETALAASVTLQAARREMTEAELAALASARLVERGIAPIVVLVGGERRLPRYRHPVPGPNARLGGRAILVICARRQGLIANLTRFVYFRRPTAEERRLNDAVISVEAEIFDATRAGATLGDVFRRIVIAYQRVGFPRAELEHHQGGLCGYRTRDEIATIVSTTAIGDRSALAWNPSLPGAKIEDTIVVDGDGLDILTVDPDWPTVEHEGRRRPDILIVG